MDESNAFARGFGEKRPPANDDDTHGDAVAERDTHVDWCAAVFGTKGGLATALVDGAVDEKAPPACDTLRWYF